MLYGKKPHEDKSTSKHIKMMMMMMRMMMMIMMMMIMMMMMTLKTVIRY